MIKGPIKVESIDEAVSFIKDVLVGTMKKSDAGDEVREVKEPKQSDYYEAHIESLRADLQAAKDELVVERHKVTLCVSELEKLANDQSPPWDNLDWQRIARECLLKVKSK